MFELIKGLIFVVAATTGSVACAQVSKPLLIRNVPGLVLEAGSVPFHCKIESLPCLLEVRVRARAANEPPVDSDMNPVFCFAWVVKRNGTPVGDIFTWKNMLLKLDLVDLDQPSQRDYKFSGYGLEFPNGPPDPNHLYPVHLTGNGTRAIWSGGALITGAGQGWNYNPYVGYAESGGVTRKCHSIDPKIANEN